MHSNLAAQKVRTSKAEAPSGKVVTMLTSGNNTRMLGTNVQRLLNRAKQNREWQAYTETLTSFNLQIRRAKSNYFRKFFKELESTPAADILHKALA